MDCLLLLEHSSDGNKNLHIANATQLFLFTQMYNHYYWSQVALTQKLYETQLEPQVNLKNSIYHSSTTQKQLFADKGDLHLCESSAEFLLEPWLVMQVPWHPAVYYQWLSAALAEVFKAEKVICEFYWWPVPHRLTSTVSKLMLLVEKLHARLNCGFRLINWLINENSVVDCGHEINCRTVKCILNLVVLPSLPTIEFLVGNKFNIVVRALKRIAWPSKGALKEEENHQVATYTGRKDDGLQPMFNIQYKGRKISHFFGEAGSFDSILDELARLPSSMSYVPTSIMYNLLVSYVFSMTFLCKVTSIHTQEKKNISIPGTLNSII
jgi:hypothetical protein